MTHVIFFPRTGACRTFESYNLAQATYPRQAILSSPADVPPDSALAWYESLFERLDSEGKHFVHGDTHVTANGARKTFPKVRLAETLALPQLQETFWELAVTCGNAVARYAPNNETGKRGKRPTGYRVDLVRANEVLAGTDRLPAQARAIVQYLTEQEFDFYTREEVHTFCVSPAFFRALRTTQDPWRIWRYYAPLLTRLGVLI